MNANVLLDLKRMVPYASIQQLPVVKIASLVTPLALVQSVLQAMNRIALMPATAKRSHALPTAPSATQQNV